MKPVLGTQINTANQLNKGLIFDAAFNNRAGEVLSDISNNKNHGSLINLPVWSPNIFGGGLDFDYNSSQYVDISDLSSKITAEATFSAWIKLNNNIPSVEAATGLAHLGRIEDDNTHYPFTDGVLYISILAVARKTVGNVGVDRSDWHMLTITTKPGANNWKFYQNGVLYYSDTGAAALGIDTTQSIGKSRQEHYIDGQISETRIYNRALTASEVVQLYLSKFKYAS